MSTMWQKELSPLCNRKNGQEYLESLGIRYRQARDYHQKNILNKINDATKNRSDEKWLEKISAYEFELLCEYDAFMLTLYSMFDIMAQMINECVCTNRKPSKDISFKGICRECKDRKICDVPQEIDKIKGSHLYEELRNYCNISKHQFVKKGTLYIHFQKTDVVAGYSPVELKKWPADTPTPNTHRVLKKYLRFCGDSVTKVGVALVGELKAKQ